MTIVALIVSNMSALPTRDTASAPSAGSQRDTVIELDRMEVIAQMPSTHLAAPRTMERQLEDAASISLIRRGAFAAEPIIRGGEGNDILITVDGARIQPACADHMDPITSYIDDIDLSGISVETGGASLASGGTAQGRINLCLCGAKPGETYSKWKINSLGTSIDNGISGSGLLEVTRPLTGFTVAGSVRSAGNYTDPQNGVVPYSGYHSGNLRANATLKAGEDSRIDASFLYDRFWDAGYPALPMDVGYSEVIHGAANMEGRFGERIAYKGQIYVNRTSHAMDDTHRTNIQMHMDMPGKAATFGAWGEMKATHSLNDLHLRFEVWRILQSASMTMYEYGAPTMYLETWPETQTLGLHGSFGDDYRFADHWSLDGLLTIENRNISIMSELGRRQADMMQPGATVKRNFFSPGLSFGVTYSQSVKNEIRIHCAFAGRSPGMDELYGYYLFNAASNRDYLGNAFLSREKDLQTEVAGKYAMGGFKVAGSLWLTIKNGVIRAKDAPDVSPMSGGAFGVRRWDNCGREIRRGIETEASYRPIRFLEIKSTASYRSGASPIGGKIPVVSYADGTTSLSIKSRYLNITPEAQWEPPQQRVDLSSYTTERAKGFFVPHFRLSGRFTVQSETIVWRAGIENVFNIKWRGAMDWENFTTRSALYRPGRSFYMGLTIGNN